MGVHLGQALVVVLAVLIISGEYGSGMIRTTLTAVPRERPPSRPRLWSSTTDLGSLPLSPWAGLGVTAGWAAAALVTGGLLLRVRDA